MLKDLEKFRQNQEGEVFRTYERLPNQDFLNPVSKRFYRIKTQNGNITPSEVEFVKDLPNQESLAVLGVTNNGTVIAAYMPIRQISENYYKACETGLFKAEGAEDIKLFFYGKINFKVIDIYKVKLWNTFAPSLYNPELFLNDKIAQKFFDAFDANTINFRPLLGFSQA